MIPPPLDDHDIARRLAQMEGWSGDRDHIEKTYLIDYHAGVGLVVDVAAAAKAMGHHPDIDIRWAGVRFHSTTHDAGNRVTELDFTLAQRIEELADRHGARTQ
jgi:4a-hydroxytetrahydrobiopterin dehydratase